MFPRVFSFVAASRSWASDVGSVPLALTPIPSSTFSARSDVPSSRCRSSTHSGPTFFARHVLYSLLELYPILRLAPQADTLIRPILHSLFACATLLIRHTTYLVLVRINYNLPSSRLRNALHLLLSSRGCEARHWQPSLSASKGY